MCFLFKGGKSTANTWDVSFSLAIILSNWRLWVCLFRNTRTGSGISCEMWNFKCFFLKCSPSSGIHFPCQIKQWFKGLNPVPSFYLCPSLFLYKQVSPLHYHIFPGMVWSQKIPQCFLRNQKVLNVGCTLQERAASAMNEQTYKWKELTGSKVELWFWNWFNSWLKGSVCIGGRDEAVST